MTRRNNTPASGYSLYETIAAAIGMARRLAWSWVVFLGVAELALLPALRHRGTQLGVDLAALAVTGVFGLAVAILPRLVLQWADRAARSGRSSEAGRPSESRREASK